MTGEVKRSPFAGLSKRHREITVDGDKIMVKPKVKDAEMFITMKQGDLEQVDAEKITKIMVGMIKRANKEEQQEDIEDYVAQHYGSLFQELSILFGFTTREELEKLKNRRFDQKK